MHIRVLQVCLFVAENMYEKSTLKFAILSRILYSTEQNLLFWLVVEEVFWVIVLHIEIRFQFT